MGYSAIKPKGKAKKEAVAAPALTDKPNEEGLFVKNEAVMHDLVHRVEEEMKAFVGEVEQHIEPEDESTEPVEETLEPAPKPKATRKKKVKEAE